MILKILKNNINKIVFAIILFALFVYQIQDGYRFFTFSITGQSIVARTQDFLTLVLSIIVEAFPFIILGVVFSVIVGVFVKEEWILKRIPKNRILSHVIISFVGIFMPVCECGNIPVARRLVLKGFSVSQSITFLLAAPILNPITYLVTAEAFSYDKSVVVIRMVAGFVIANFVGILISFKKDQNDLLTPEFYQQVCEIHEHDSKSKFRQALEIFEEEFIQVIKVLCIGAILAALSQTLIPREFILSLGQNPFLSIIAMIILAFVVSICSNVDAFFALSYANSFTIGSILSFLVFGPMIDIKILAMMKTTYKTKVLVMVLILVTLMSILLGLLVNYFK